MIFNNAYNPMDWYWFVGDDKDQVFSSGAVAYKPATDPTYVTWSASHPTTKILNAEELYDVLVDQWLPTYVLTGVQIESTDTPSLNDVYPMDQASTQTITGIATSISAGRGLPGGGTTFRYKGHTFTEAAFLDFATAAENWLYAVQQSLGKIVLTGSGSMPVQPVTIP